MSRGRGGGGKGESGDPGYSIEKSFHKMKKREQRAERGGGGNVTHTLGTN